MSDNVGSVNSRGLGTPNPKVEKGPSCYLRPYVSCGGVEMGQGLHAALVSTVADALGVRPERVFVNPTDTATCPWDVGTHASRGAFIAGNAAILACHKARDRIFELAAEVFPAEVQRNLARAGGPPPTIDVEAEAKARRFELRDGVLSLRDAPDDPRLRLDLGQVLRAIHFRGERGQMIAAEAFFEPKSELPDWEKGRGNLSATYAFGAQGVEVEVELDARSTPPTIVAATKCAMRTDPWGMPGCWRRSTSAGVRPSPSAPPASCTSPAPGSSRSRSGS